MNLIHVKSKILFDDGVKYYYPDKAGIVSSLFSYTMGIEIPDVNKEFKNFSSIEFDFEYNDKSTIDDLIVKLMEYMNFKHGLTFPDNPSPLHIFVENDLIRINNNVYNFQKLLNKFNIQDNLTVYLLYCSQAGTIWNEDGIRYYMNSRESGSHHKPHVHIDYRYEEEASVAIEDGAVLAGNIPSRVLNKVQEKIRENKKYLFQCWNDMTDGLDYDINYHFGNIELITE